MLKIIIILILVIIISVVVVTKRSAGASNSQSADLNTAERPEHLDTRLDPSLMAAHDAVDPEATGSWKIVSDVIISINEELDAIDSNFQAVHLLTEARRTIYIVFWAKTEIDNGGLAQYYFNSAGNQAAIAPDALRELNLSSFAEIIEEANSFFPNQLPSADRSQRLTKLKKVEKRAADTWDRLDTEFYSSNSPCNSAMIEYIRAHKRDFYKVD